MELGLAKTKTKMKKIGSLLAALFVFAASFVPTAHANNPCILTTVVAQDGYLCGLRQGTMIPGMEYMYDNGDFFSAFRLNGCVGNAFDNVAELRVYVWDIAGHKWVFQGRRYITLAYGCESVNGTLTNWHTQDCSLGFNGFTPAPGSPYCPCQQQ